jgi:hypothetical protein
MTIQDIIENNKEEFPNDFLEWIPNNLHVFDAFVTEAIKVRNKGFKHYSARTIIHVLRHHSAIAETGSEWKINNNHSPYLARLFDLVYPDKAGLFEYRATSKAYIDAHNRSWSNHHA